MVRPDILARVEDLGEEVRLSTFCAVLYSQCPGHDGWQTQKTEREGLNMQVTHVKGRRAKKLRRELGSRGTNAATMVLIMGWRGMFRIIPEEPEPATTATTNQDVVESSRDPLPEGGVSAA